MGWEMRKQMILSLEILYHNKTKCLTETWDKEKNELNPENRFPGYRGIKINRKK